MAFNAPTGWAVAVGRRGINKTLNDGARREHMQSVPAPLALLAALVLGEAANAVTYRVRLIVKETNEGYHFYDHDLSAPPADARPAAD